MHFIRVDNIYYGVNDEYEGLFMRRKADDCYRQLEGTAQFRAETPEELERKLRERGTLHGNYCVQEIGW